VVGALHLYIIKLILTNYIENYIIYCGIVSSIFKKEEIMKKTLIFITGILLVMSLCLVLPATAFTIISPNGGENWQAGTTHQITWYRDEFEGPLPIEINLLRKECYPFHGTNLCLDVVQSKIDPSWLSEMDSYTWKIPITQNPGSFYRIELRSILGTNHYYDRSDDYFTISAAAPLATIKIKSPNGGEIVYLSHPLTITWTDTGPLKTNKVVDIDLIKGDPNNNPLIIPIVKNYNMGKGSNGKYDFMTESNPVGNDYKVRIQRSSDNHIYDVSNGYFTIAAVPTITITSPKGGESWVKGTTQTITWDYTGKFQTGINLYYTYVDAPIPPWVHHPHGQITPIAQNVNIGNSGKGSYDWKIPSDIIDGSRYKIFFGGARYGKNNEWVVSGESKMFTIISGAPSP
jgi:hypothetical protein